MHNYFRAIIRGTHTKDLIKYKIISQKLIINAEQFNFRFYNFHNSSPIQIPEFKTEKLINICL